MENVNVETHIIAHPTVVIWKIPSASLHCLKPPGISTAFSVNAAVGDNANKIKNGLVKFSCGLIQLEEHSYDSEFEHDGNGERVYFYIKPEIPKSVTRLEGKFVLEVLNYAGQPCLTLKGHDEWVSLNERDDGTYFGKYYYKLFNSIPYGNANLDSDRKLNIKITFNVMAPHTLKHLDEQMLKARVAEIVGVGWASDMEHLLEDPSDADFWIKTSDGEKFPVHKLILKTRVPYFRKMFGMGNWRESGRRIMETPTISSGAMRILLHFIYTGKLHDDWRVWRSTVNEVLDGAKQYGLDGLVIYYDHLLITVCNDVDTEDLLEISKLYDLKQAQDDISSFQNSIEPMTV